MGELGRWISAETKTPFYARKEFELNERPVQAYALACGLGQFVFHVNGQKASDHELDPGWTDYRKYIQYVRFDVTDMLKEGINVIGSEIANGWFIKDDTGYTFRFPEFMPPNPNPYIPYGESLVFAMKLVMTFRDGSEQVITADDSFRVIEHPALHSNVYGSEIYDASREQKGWLEAGFDDSSWRNAVIVPEGQEPAGEMAEQFQPPVRVIHTYEAAYMHYVNGRRIYDLSQNISGMLEFDIKGRKGDAVRIFPAEKLDSDGDADQTAKGWTEVNTVITYIIGSDETEHYRQKFSYSAGRYLAVEMPEGVILANLKGHAITSAYENSGSFICDDERYSRIYDMIEKTVEANMLSVHTDCPTIERFAWQEPNHLMAPSIMFMKNGRKLWEKFFLDIRHAQHGKDDIFHDFAGNSFPAGDGLVPSQCPCYIPNVLPVPGMGSFYDIIPWGSTCILGVKWHYLFYGDEKVIEDNFETGLRYLAYLKTKMTPEGFISHGLGDWGNPDQILARENIETAFLYADADTLAQFAHILGREEEKELRRFAEEVRENYNSRLLEKDENGRYAYRCFDRKDAFVKTQACEALPLFWNMVPAYAQDDVVQALRETLLEKDSLSAGEIGLPYIIQTASRFGMNDLIARFITKPEHPSYYAFILDGMTTLGEYWETNPRSHCHDMMGHIIEWYYSGIAGIEPVRPGFKAIRLHPYMPEGMDHFRCTYNTPHGMITAEGKRIDGNIEYTYSVPQGISVLP